jgi:AbrB family looped-hinge helix DNA binding protein
VNTVTTKGQVIIPKPVRDLLKIGPGSIVEFVMEPDGRIVLRKASDAADAALPANRFDRLRGSVGARLSTDEIMALTRGEA